MEANKVLGGFRMRKLPISPDYRPMYKIGLIALILGKASFASKSSLNRLHFFIWATKSIRNMKFIKDILDSGQIDRIVVWGVEPALNKALSFGVAEGLFLLKDDKYVLTNQGKLLCKSIEKDTELLKDEKVFLYHIGKKGVTESFINLLIEKMRN